MTIFVETPRLILRELLSEDADVMFALDSDPDVMKYIGEPVATIEQSRTLIEYVRRQYVEDGIGRWAIVEKSSNAVLGWSGLKFVTASKNNHVNYYDIGYRLLKQHWGKGIATESAKAALDYGFEHFTMNEIFATAEIKNVASGNVLRKIGLKHVETFDDDGYAVGWYAITREAWRRELTQPK